MCSVLASVAAGKGETEMTDSQKWCIWLPVLAVGFVAAFCAGGTWLAVMIYIVGRLAGRIGVLVLIGAAASAHARRA
jgi:biotin transporter BioY